MSASKGEGAATPNLQHFAYPFAHGSFSAKSRFWPETPKFPEVGKIVSERSVGVPKCFLGGNVSSQFRGVPGGSGEFRGRWFFNVYVLPRVPGSCGELSLIVAKQRFSEEKSVTTQNSQFVPHNRVKADSANF